VALIGTAVLGDVALAASAGWTAAVTVIVATVTGLLGLAGGAAAAARTTARHQQAEAARERLRNTAVEYVDAYEKLDSALYSFRHWILDAVEGDARAASVPFHELVALRVDRMTLYTKFLEEVTPKYFELRKAGTRTNMTFSPTWNVNAPVSAIADLFTEESNLYGAGLTPLKSKKEYEDKLGDLSKRRGAELSRFVERAREATSIPAKGGLIGGA
jgi:hypothetical protein